VKDELLIGYGELEQEDLIIRYKEYEDDGFGGLKFVVIQHKIQDIGFFPIDTEIFVTDTIGLNLDKDAEFGAADSTKVVMKTSIYIDCGHDGIMCNDGSDDNDNEPTPTD